MKACSVDLAKVCVGLMVRASEFEPLVSVGLFVQKSRFESVILSLASKLRWPRLLVKTLLHLTALAVKG
jgi:hypothetical protein